MNCQINQNLTPEKYQEIKTQLENENLEKFPSLFQQARNLAKQAWTSGIDVAKGKPLLASAEKAAARLEICQGCEFFKQDRCLKCGCFMNAKIHVESAACPINKWGADLQRIYSQEELNRMKQQVSPNQSNQPNMEIDISKFPSESANEIKELMENSLMYDGRFSYKGVQYIVRFDPSNGAKKLHRLHPRATPMSFRPPSSPPLPPPKIVENITEEIPSVEKNKDFLSLVEKHKADDQSKIFEFNGTNYYINQRPDKTFGVYRIDQENLEKLFKPIQLV